MKKQANSQPKTKSAFLSIVGKPNVGKSSIMNAMLGQKVAIVSPKPQTTRCLLYTSHVLVAANSLSTYLDQDDLETFTEECQASMVYLKHLWESEQPSFGNIL